MLAPPVLIGLYALVILIVINIFYKLLINHDEVKAVKDRVKELKEQSKQFQKEGNKEKSTQLMSEMLAENNKVMKMTMKPMIISFIIVIIFLPFLSGMYADITTPLEEGSGEVTIGQNLYQLSLSDNVLTITGDTIETCDIPCRKNIENIKWNVRQTEDNIKFARIVTILPVSIPILGDAFGWLGWYIIVSIPLMILIRKILKINV